MNISNIYIISLCKIFDREYYQGSGRSEIGLYKSYKKKSEQNQNLTDETTPVKYNNNKILTHL